MYKQIDSNKRKTIVLIILFIAVILFMGWFFGWYTGYQYPWLIGAMGFSIFMTIFSYYRGDKVLLWSVRAKPIVKEDNPYVYRIVENLAITAGLPIPKIYIIDDPAPNAFATGRDPKHASIAITSGLIERLENEELEGVLAHELSHIKNFDIRLMMVVAILVGMIAMMSQWLFYSWGGNRRSGGQGGILIFGIGILLALLSPLIAQGIKMAISRSREYLADASGALLTRYPEGLANALEKITAYQGPMKRANNGMAHLYIANPFGVRAGKGIAHLFATHPPVEERIKKLRQMT